MYEISQLLGVSLITRNDAKARLKVAGIRFDDSPQEAKTTKMSFIPTRIFGKMLNVKNADWFWYANDIFTTSGPEGLLNEQAVHVDVALDFLHKNQRYAERVRNFAPHTREELEVWNILKEGLP